MHFPASVTAGITSSFLAVEERLSMIG